ncbi:MAG: sigma 54-interacting transcriptional regulator [Desulfobacterales bacterium]|nr:sigma 54-interacting transcriptional regulator [Desulfobacterales bacterium]
MTKEVTDREASSGWATTSSMPRPTTPTNAPSSSTSRASSGLTSRLSKRLIGIDPDEAVGKHIKDVIKETRLHEILKDGKGPDRRPALHRRQAAGHLWIPSRIFTERFPWAPWARECFNEAVKVAELSKRIEVMDGHLQYYQKQVSDLKGGATIVGRTAAITKMKENAMLAAMSNASVLMTGESGTGKEVVAFFIHQNSARADGPFIRVNCASIPRELFESELFGYEGGAFTGARSQGKPGKFELANKGTILLDEIGEMPWPMQAKLAEGTPGTHHRPAGRDEADRHRFPPDCRHQPRPPGDGAQGGFPDGSLLPHQHPQHSRAAAQGHPGGHPPACRSSRRASQRGNGLGASAISPEAMEELKNYDWPGNVRELRNVIERAMIIAKERLIRPEDLPERVRRAGSGRALFPGPPRRPAPRAGNPRRSPCRDGKADSSWRPWRSAGRGNKAKAARILGASTEHRLYEKMRDARPGPGRRHR